MKTNFSETPRRFDSDGTGRFVITDLGTIELDADEQVTFVARSGSEYDVSRKRWGYYAAPSLNGRLPAKGLRPVLARNDAGRYFMCLVEAAMEREFRDYLAQAGMHALGWLDDRATLDRIETALREV